jgi:glycosyltransferase involved in cell wall biosynthesis
MLPIGVVIPTKNSMSSLPVHLRGMREWLDLVDQVVVVDSDSSDGTVEYLRGKLSHPDVTYTSHPPGLYASWNHAIARIRSPWVLIATVGDIMTRAGLERLHKSARSLDCEVIMSKPEFRDQADRKLPDVFWPIDDIIKTLEITAPRRLTRWEAIIFAASHPLGALLGSCASNLFRAEVLRRFPFPADFGTAGDGAWGWLHAAEVSWGIVPEKFSSFLVHPTSASRDERESLLAARRMDQVLQASMDSWLCAGVITVQDLNRFRWVELLGALTSFLDAKTVFDRDRRGPVPWVMNPRAWKNRITRQKMAWRLRRLKREALLPSP